MATSTGGRVDVVVCGAGPVGLTAAALLAARDVNVVVLEQNHSTSDEPKAISIDDESLRVYQQAGVVDQILPIVVPGTGTCYYDRFGELLFHARGSHPFRFGFPFKNPFAQPDLERALSDTLRQHPRACLRFDTRVLGVEHSDEAVDVSAVTGSGEQIVLRARYLLGCDGGRSATRLLQEVGMTGRSHSEVWLVADTHDDHHTQRFAMHHGDPDRPHVIVPGLDGRCRYEFRLFDGEGEAGEPPSFDLIRRLVSRYRTIEPHHIERAVNYRFNAVVADRWMIGRSFLLGDAAHMMPPFAGQGLNSGIRDAANLTWKVADVLAGKLDPGVLSSYERERVPHARATVQSSERLGRIVMTTSPGIAARRDERVREAIATTDGRTFLEHMRYRPTAKLTEGLVTGGDAPDVGVTIGQPLVFDVRAHDVRRLDDSLGTGWALIGVDVNADDWSQVDTIAEAVAAHRALVVVEEHFPRSIEHTLIDVDGQLIREFGAYSGRFVLLRPDHVVAAAWNPDETSSIAESVIAWTIPSAPTPPTERVLSNG